MMEAAATVVAEAAGVHGGQQLIDPASACLCPAQGCATDEGCGCVAQGDENALQEGHSQLAMASSRSSKPRSRVCNAAQ